MPGNPRRAVTRHIDSGTFERPCQPLHRARSRAGLPVAAVRPPRRAACPHGPGAGAGAAARLDLRGGSRLSAGRIGVLDEGPEPLLVDWRAPAAQPFYRATPAAPG